MNDIKKVTQQENGDYIFNVEIHFTKKALECWMAQTNGLSNLDVLAELDDLTIKNNKDIIDKDPSFWCGLGADINDLVSVGLITKSKMNNWGLSLDDVFLHPFSLFFEEIEKMEMSYQRIEVTSKYKPMTMAIELGNEIEKKDFPF